MPSPGEPVDSVDLPFVHRRIEPLPDPANALLVLLHGVGGDELQLVDIGLSAPGATLVAMPRGQRTISGERLGWYRVGLGGDAPHIVEDEAEDARMRLVEFITGLQARHGIDASRTVLCGFSQGGALAATVALTEPACVGAFAMLSGRLLPEYEGREASRVQLARLRALAIHTIHDEVLPVGTAREDAARLRALGIDTDLRLHDGGHCILPAAIEDAAAWLHDVLGPASS